MLMQNFGVTDKEHYGMLWYFWSGQLIVFSFFRKIPVLQYREEKILIKECGRSLFFFSNRKLLHIIDGRTFLSNQGGEIGKRTVCYITPRENNYCQYSILITPKIKLVQLVSF